MLKSFCQGEITPHRLKKRSMQRIVLLKFVLLNIPKKPKLNISKGKYFKIIGLFNSLIGHKIRD